MGWRPVHQAPLRRPFLPGALWRWITLRWTGPGSLLAGGPVRLVLVAAGGIRTTLVPVLPMLRSAVLMPFSALGAVSSFLAGRILSNSWGCRDENQHSQDEHHENVRACHGFTSLTET